MIDAEEKQKNKVWWEEEKGGDKKETGERKERKTSASVIAEHPIHSTGKKRVGWFKGQNARTGFRGGEGGGGGGVLQKF